MAASAAKGKLGLLGTLWLLAALALFSWFAITIYRGLTAAWVPRSISGQAFLELGMTVEISDLGRTRPDVLLAPEYPQGGRHYFVVTFNNRADVIVRSARVNLTIKATEGGRVLFNGKEECASVGGLYVRPRQLEERWCGFPLTVAVSDYIAAGGKPILDWSIAVDGTRPPIRLEAIIGDWFAFAEVSLRNGVAWFLSLFERV